MSFFCFLWIPLFTFFWLSFIPGKRRNTGGVWALFGGSIAALLHYYNGPLVTARGFGLTRWLSALVDFVGLPVGLPFLIFALFLLLRILSPSEGLTNFVLLWLIPEGVLLSLNGDVLNDPSRLILAPLLWTTIAVGIPFFLQSILKPPRWMMIIAIIAIPLQFFLAATTYWAFFIQHYTLGYGLLGLTLLIFLIVLYLSRKKYRDMEEKREPLGLPY